MMILQHSKLPYLNVGCGHKYNPLWHNIDMRSFSKDVAKANLINGIPFPDNSFEVVYHSQVLEHIPKENAIFFISECFRVLRTGGVLRVVVPDLENIVKEYLRVLETAIDGREINIAKKYDWVMLELYDQVIRDRTGGEMASYLRTATSDESDYAISRGGSVIRSLREDLQNPKSFLELVKLALSSRDMFGKATNFVRETAIRILAPRAYSSGRFRMSGEVHLWMYDRYSLARLLESVGFVNPVVLSPTESRIPNWSEYALDVKDGYAVDPTSLFVEAVKSS